MPREYNALEPRKQRQVNAKLAEEFGPDRYGDWFDYANACFSKGQGIADIVNNFEVLLGVKITNATLYNWLRARRAASDPAQAAVA